MKLNGISGNFAGILKSSDAYKWQHLDIAFPAYPIMKLQSLLLNLYKIFNYINILSFKTLLLLVSGGIPI